MKVEHSVRFELTWSFRSPVLQTGAFSRSATSAMTNNGAESRTRTDDVLLTMQLLCQLSYLGDVWGDVRGSNPQPPSSQPGALPIELTPPSNRLAGKVGLEPTLAESESAVLPLDDFPAESSARCISSRVNGVPDGIRTRVLALKARCPGRTRRRERKGCSHGDSNPSLLLEREMS